MSANTLRMPDGAFVTIRPGTAADELQAALDQRRLARRPRPVRLETRGEAPQLFDALRTALAPFIRPDDETAPALVVWALSGLDDEDAADECLTAGNPVLRVHRELDVLLLHPLADPHDPQAVRASDLRRRRSAASPAADLLEQWWPEHGHQPLTDLPLAAAQLAAAHLLHCCLNWLHRTPVTDAPLLRRIEMDPLRVSDHPVIRVPRCEPRVLAARKRPHP